MSKIEAYKAAKNVALRVSEGAARALGKDRVDNDKGAFRAAFVKLSNASWSPIEISIHMSYGYYGCSSGYSATSNEMGEYLARAIEAHKSLLLEAAVSYAQADAEKARLAAEEEARKVLLETSAA